MRILLLGAKLGLTPLSRHEAWANLKLFFTKLPNSIVFASSVLPMLLNMPVLFWTACAAGHITGMWLILTIAAGLPVRDFAVCDKSVTQRSLPCFGLQC